MHIIARLEKSTLKFLPVDPHQMLFDHVLHRLQGQIATLPLHLHLDWDDSKGLSCEVAREAASNLLEAIAAHNRFVLLHVIHTLLGDVI